MPCADNPAARRPFAFTADSLPPAVNSNGAPSTVRSEGTLCTSPPMTPRICYSSTATGPCSSLPCSRAPVSRCRARPCSSPPVSSPPVSSLAPPITSKSSWSSPPPHSAPSSAITSVTSSDGKGATGYCPATGTPFGWMRVSSSSVSICFSSTAKVVFFGRFVSMPRAWAALLAGVNRMP